MWGAIAPGLRPNLDTPEFSNIHYRPGRVKETAPHAMRLPREFVAYMAKKVLKKLSDAGLIQFDQPDYVTEVITRVMLDEMSVEDRINEEVRMILEQHGEKMKEYGATYDEAFKVVKQQLVRERKVIL